jgi:hypothetical protein
MPFKKSQPTPVKLSKPQPIVGKEAPNAETITVASKPWPGQPLQPKEFTNGLIMDKNPSHRVIRAIPGPGGKAIPPGSMVNARGWRNRDALVRTEHLEKLEGDDASV